MWIEYTLHMCRLSMPFRDRGGVSRFVKRKINSCSSVKVHLPQMLILTFLLHGNKRNRLKLEHKVFNCDNNMLVWKSAMGL